MAYTATLSCLHLLDCLNSDGFHCYFNTGNLPCLHSLSYLTQLHPQCCLSWPAISKETLRQYLADRLYLTHICCLAIAPLHTSPNFRSLCLVICCPIYWQISHLTSTIIRMHWNIPKLTPLLINMRMYLQASITFVIISCLIILSFSLSTKAVSFSSFYVYIGCAVWYQSVWSWIPQPSETESDRDNIYETNG